MRCGTPAQDEIRTAKNCVERARNAVESTSAALQRSRQVLERSWKLMGVVPADESSNSQPIAVASVGNHRASRAVQAS